MPWWKMLRNIFGVPACTGTSGPVLSDVPERDPSISRVESEPERAVGLHRVDRLQPAAGRVQCADACMFGSEVMSRGRGESFFSQLTYLLFFSIFFTSCLDVL